MIRLLERIEIDDNKWNECIKNSLSPQVFGCTFYLDSCCPDWSAFVFDDYTAVFPFAVKKKHGLRYLTQPYFVRHFGIYSTTPSIQFNDWIQPLSKLTRYFNFDVFNLENDEWKGFKVSEKKYQLLDLNFHHSELRKKYSESHLRKIKKLEALETNIVDINDYSIFINEFKLTVAAKELNYSERELATLHRLMNTLPHHCKVISKGIFIAGSLAAAAYFVKYENRLLYLKGFRKKHPVTDNGMFFLFDSIIKDHCNQKMFLDFGGSNDQNVRQFFRGFGAEDSVYLHLHKNDLPFFFRWFKK